MNVTSIRLSLVAGAVLVAGLAAVQTQASDVSPIVAVKASIYGQCIAQAKGDYEGLGLDRLAGKGAQAAALHTRAITAHCEAFRSGMVAQWTNFEQSCVTNAADVGSDGLRLKPAHVADMQTTCKTMADIAGLH